MADSNTIRIKRKMLGVLMCNARNRTGFTLDEMAKRLNISSQVLADYEFGRREAGLPVLEALARFSNVSISYFWSDGDLPEGGAYPASRAIPIRRKIIGVLLHKARTEAGHSSDKVAKFLNCSVEQLNNYEYGKADIPFSQLASLTSFFNVPLDYFLDDVQAAPPAQSNGQASAPPAQAVAAPPPVAATPTSIVPSTLSTAAPVALSGDKLRKIGDIPEEVVTFLEDPTSVLYLKLAMRLQSVSAETLRALAEGILDITY